MKMTQGKLKRLNAVADKNGVISAAAMDQRGSLQKSIAKEKGIDPKSVTPEMMSEFKVAVSRILTPHASAILLDPEFGLEAVKAKASHAGVLLAYEQTGYDQTQEGRIPTLIPNWTVKKCIESGGNCLKVLLYYSPFESEPVKDIKHAFVARIGAECAHYEVPFFLEFVGYDPAGGDEKGLEFAKQKPAIVSGSMKEFSKPEYNVDVLKVEVPVNMEYVEGSRANKSGKVAYTKKEAMDHFRRAAVIPGQQARPFPDLVLQQWTQIDRGKMSEVENLHLEAPGGFRLAKRAHGGLRTASVVLSSGERQTGGQGW